MNLFFKRLCLRCDSYTLLLKGKGQSGKHGQYSVLSQARHNLRKPMHSQPSAQTIPSSAFSLVTLFFLSSPHSSTCALEALQWKNIGGSNFVCGAST